MGLLRSFSALPSSSSTNSGIRRLISSASPMNFAS